MDVLHPACCPCRQRATGWSLRMSRASRDKPHPHLCIPQHLQWPHPEAWHLHQPCEAWLPVCRGGVGGTCRDERDRVTHQQIFVPSHIAFSWPALAGDSLVVSSREGIAEKGYWTPLSSSSALAATGPKSVCVDSGG